MFQIKHQKKHLLPQNGNGGGEGWIFNSPCATSSSSEEKLGCERSGPWTAPSTVKPTPLPLSTNQLTESRLLLWRLSIKLKVQISVEAKAQL